MLSLCYLAANVKIPRGNLEREVICPKGRITAALWGYGGLI
jgi:hypothetical protein